MKRSVWIMIITVITACCVFGVTFYHIFRYEKGFWGNGEITDMSLDLEAFDALSVDADLMDVTITAGERFHLSCQYTDGLGITYEVKDGKLAIRQRAYQRRLGVNNECVLTLTIPEQTEMRVVDVHTALGNIQLEGISASECGLLCNMGSNTIKKCSFDRSDLNTNMGEISVSDTDLGDSEVNNDMGEIEIDDCAFGDLAITAAMGGVTIDAAQTLEDYDMELVADLGSVNVNNRSESTHFRQSGDAGKLSVNTSVGSVRLSY